MELNRLHMIIVEDSEGAQLLCNRVGPGSDTDEGHDTSEADSNDAGTRCYVNWAGAAFVLLVAWSAL